MWRLHLLLRCSAAGAKGELTYQTHRTTGRLPAALTTGGLTNLTLKDTIANLLAITFHILGFAIGCVIWMAVGLCLGNLASAPQTGVLCGLAYQTGCYFCLHEQMEAALERSRLRFATALAAL